MKHRSLATSYRERLALASAIIGLQNRRVSFAISAQFFFLPRKRGFRVCMFVHTSLHLVEVGWSSRFWSIFWFLWSLSQLSNYPTYVVHWWPRRRSTVVSTQMYWATGSHMVQLVGLCCAKWLVWRAARLPSVKLSFKSSFASSNEVCPCCWQPQHQKAAYVTHEMSIKIKRVKP